MRATAHFLTLILAAACCGAALAQPNLSPMAGKDTTKGDDRIEGWHGKKIMVFTPHPDDDHFGIAGTLAKLAANGNDITVVIYTNDNKGSKDPEMYREKLAEIRRAEEEKASAILGLSKEHLIWLGYEDGDLEYANPQVLRGTIARLLKKTRPDAVFSPDPGTRWVEWHKTDHRMAANITKDAFIACEWPLYYPQHYLDEGLTTFSVPVCYYYYSQEPNYEVDITDTMQKKEDALIAHTSQWEPSTSKYTPTLPEEVIKEIRAGLQKENTSEIKPKHKKDAPKFVERFRRELLP